VLQMPEEKEVPNLLRQVSFNAQETKTRIKYFAPKETQARDFYWELPFEMKFTGPYHNVGYFFDGIRKLERIIHITSFSLEAKEVGQKVVLEGTCVAKTYVFMKDPAKEKEKEKKKEGKNEPPKK
jgi:type IV pilus assembly protein PilO